MAGIQGPGVDAGDLVNLAWAMSKPLDQTPDAPVMADLGVNFSGDAIFMFAGPAGMPEDARNALAAAIAEVTTDEASKAGGLIKKAFGGALTVQGAELDALVNSAYAESEVLIKAASE